MKTISVEQLGLETGKMVGEARKRPILVRTARGETLVLRALSDDDAVDELLMANPRFRESIRRGRRNRAQGKGIPLAQIRRALKT